MRPTATSKVLEPRTACRQNLQPERKWLLRRSSGTLRLVACYFGRHRRLDRIPRSNHLLRKKKRPNWPEAFPNPRRPRVRSVSERAIVPVSHASNVRSSNLSPWLMHGRRSRSTAFPVQVGLHHREVVARRGSAPQHCVSTVDAATQDDLIEPMLPQTVGRRSGMPVDELTDP